VPPHWVVAMQHPWLGLQLCAGSTSAVDWLELELVTRVVNAMSAVLTMILFVFLAEFL
jgi:hypothetical protein